MRKHLLQTFDKIYILDLHGNAKKKEMAPDGSKDENVFDIQQGVSISILIRKTDEKDKHGIVKFAELHGRRENKFFELNQNKINKINWVDIKISEPNYFFVPKYFQDIINYKNGFAIEVLFNKWASGVATAKDDFIIKFTRQEIIDLKNSFNLYTDQQIAYKYNVNKEKVTTVREDLTNITEEFSEILYRPFDKRFTLYSPTSDGIFQRPRPELMKHLLKDNLAILTCKKQTTFNFQHTFISKYITDRCAVSLQTGEVGYVFPLYLYSEDGTKIPNLKKEIVDELEKIVGKISPENILDYIYAVLHSPKYRKKYKEFLKIDFPRVPYPKNKENFKNLVEFGTELRSLHLLESSKVNQFITTYPVAGSDTVEKIRFEISASSKETPKQVRGDTGKVFINKEQYFGNVPESAWCFYIGGYQPAQKWLKDRKGRTLTNNDIEHYQKIIVVLAEIMKEIDEIYLVFSR